MLSVNTTKDGTYTNVQVVFNNSLICDNYTVQVGTAKTIPVAEGYYYRLTDEFVPSEGLQYKNNNTYLILDRNAQGNGVMMISQGICDKNVIPADVTVALDADGVPCVRSESMLTSTKLRFQEWMYHYHSDGTFYLMQPNLGDANVGYNNNLRVAAPGGAILVTGSPDAYSIKNPVMSSSDNYTTTSGNVNVAGASMYLQYNSAAKQFQGVLAANRKQGSEIYIYEKVTYNTASASVVGLNGKVSKGSAATAKTGTEISITYPDGRQELVPVTANMLYKNGKALTATDLKNNTTLTGLTLKYQGITLASNYVLTI
jgi:hypothetical protein